MNMDLSKLRIDSTTKEVDVLLKKVEERITNTGRPYCFLTVNDFLRNEYNIQFWNHSAESLLSIVEEKTVVTMDIYAKIFNENLSLEARKIYQPDHDINIGDFITLPKRSTEELYQECLDMISEETIYGKIVHSTYKIFKKQLCSTAGGQKIHHDYIGGLIEHLHGVAKVCDALCDIYTDMDRDMLIAGALLHDIGKIFEMDTDQIGITEYTLSGVQLGHLVLGIKTLMKVTEKLGLYNTKERQTLEAMIASHHNTKEMDAIKVPNFKEAFMLAMADNIDAKNNIFNKEYEKLEHGELASKKSFSAGNVQVWRP